MDANQFDALTRAVRGHLPRRTMTRLLLGIAGGAVAGVPAWLMPEGAAAACVKLGKTCKKNGEIKRCCGGAICRRKTCKCAAGQTDCGGKCVDLLTDAKHCGACGQRCPSGKCVQGTCTCDPFDNQCPMSAEGQCGCGAIVAEEFEAACVDRFSACDLDRPCDTNEECGPGSVCLLGCSDPPGNPRRCSTPCTPI